MVFELKNYTGKIGQNQVYSTEKYLFKGAFRSVAIIFSRLEPNDNAVEASRGAMRDGEKLLIHVSDTDICKMLELRDDDDDPADYLFAPRRRIPSGARSLKRSDILRLSKMRGPQRYLFTSLRFNCDLLSRLVYYVERIGDRDAPEANRVPPQLPVEVTIKLPPGS